MGKGQFSPIEKKQERIGQRDKNGDSENASGEVTDYVTPPDGGWGWIVVLSSFLIHVIADGIVYSFGVFLMEFVDYFKTGRGAVSWIGALQPAVTFTVGPISSALTNRYGCRIVTIIGAIIASLGFVISVWAPNLYYLYFSAGILTGIGFGLIYLPAIVCVAQYFEKKRSLATGLAVCGSGFGTFILAPFTELLVHEYSWQGAMMILGGIILNIVVCGIIFRPLESSGTPARKYSAEAESDTLLSNTDQEEAELLKGGDIISIEAVELLSTRPLSVDKGHGDGDGNKTLTTTETRDIINSMQALHVLPNGTAAKVMKDNSENIDIFNRTPSVETTDDSKDFSGDSEKGSNKYQLSASNCRLSTDRCHNMASLALSDSALNKVPDEQSQLQSTTMPRRRSHRHSESSHGSSGNVSPLHRKDIFYSGSLQNIPMYRSQPDVYKATVAGTHGPEAGSASNKREKKADGCCDISEEFRTATKDLLSFSLLKNPVFLMFAFSNFFTSIGFNMPFIFLPDRAKLAGIDEDKAALLLSVIGVANTAGRVIFGFLSDRPWVNRLMLYNTALTICGLATALSPIFGGDYGLMVVYAAVFGIFIGVYVSLTSIVLVDLLGLEYLTNSFGLLLLFQGAATFVGPPIAGWLCDWTGSYDISFILMGALIALSGAMLFFLPCVERYYERRIPTENIVHDMELGKHPVTKDGVEMISIEQIPSEV